MKPYPRPRRTLPPPPPLLQWSVYRRSNFVAVVLAHTRETAEGIARVRWPIDGILVRKYRGPNANPRPRKWVSM